MVNLNIPHGDFIHQHLTQTPKTISFQINQIAHKHIKANYILTAERNPYVIQWPYVNTLLISDNNPCYFQRFVNKYLNIYFLSSYHIDCCFDLKN